MKKWLWAFLFLLSAISCDRSREEKTAVDNTAEVLDRSNEMTSPEPQAIPVADRPFVEPPLKEKPAKLHWVSAGCVQEPEQARGLLDTFSALEFVPPGYPALAQNPRPIENCPFFILLGKFARSAFAERLAELVRERLKIEVSVLQETYSHDRFSPAAWLDYSRPGVGRCWAGLPGEKIPLFAQPSLESPSLGQIVDGIWLSVLDAVEEKDARWFRVKKGGLEGYLPSGRLLCGHNVYPAPDGRRALVSVEVGCDDERCRYDWWLVDKNLVRRQLLAPAQEKFFHAFSPDGRYLAWAGSAKTMRLEILPEGRTQELGSGVSPSWSSDSHRLYFRRPAENSQRDEVVHADSPDWQVKVLYDFPGRPFYPRKLSVIPPAVDVLSADSRLYTMFFRLIEKDGGLTLVRWKVVLDSNGNLLTKKAEQLTE